MLDKQISDSKIDLALRTTKGAFILESLGIDVADIVARVETMSTFVRRRRPMHTDASMNAPLMKDICHGHFLSYYI